MTGTCDLPPVSEARWHAAPANRHGGVGRAFPLPCDGRTGPRCPRTDVYETDDSYVVVCELPG
ncbi:hypothetical protein JW921_04040, partial [Candidatus Fermentibacterales bacterium]|nr:hypothetical protein [Candidatus Fermentibacterales bacterium]